MSMRCALGLPSLDSDCIASSRAACGVNALRGTLIVNFTWSWFSMERPTSASLLYVGAVSIDSIPCIMDWATTCEADFIDIVPRESDGMSCLSND